MVRAITQKQLDAARAAEAHSKSELHLLQSQISPHFLFNTLNNMYGLSINQHEKVPALLLKLSELLRYSVYDATEMFVPLKDELTYICNYIEFEKIRIGSRLMLTTAFEENIGADCKIAPMLLIVFIENAFKHGVIIDSTSFIDISIAVEDKNLLFTCSNKNHSLVRKMPDEKSGIGLENVKRRLDLLYPGKHTLEIKSDEDKFRIILKIDLS